MERRKSEHKLLCLVVCTTNAFGGERGGLGQLAGVQVGATMGFGQLLVYFESAQLLGQVAFRVPSLVVKLS